MHNMIDLLFNEDGTINYESSILYLPDIVSSEQTDLMNRSFILDYVSEQTNIRVDILDIYLDDMVFEKVLLNNPLPINVLINHRHFIVNQLVRLLAFDYSDYVNRHISEEGLTDSPLLLFNELCKHHKDNHLILEYIFKEVYFGLYDMYLNEAYPCRVSPFDYLEYASEHLLCLFSKEFIFHHQHLFDLSKLLAFYENMDDLTSWLFDDWFTPEDVLKATQILIDKINDLKQMSDASQETINQHTKRIFMLQTILSKTKSA